MEISYQRPKFWLHRSGRFWFGLVVLLFLGSSCLISYFRTDYVSCERERYTATQRFHTDTSLEVSMGTLLITHSASTEDMPGMTFFRSPRWKWGYHSISNPTHPSDAYSDEDIHCCLPLWIAPLLWTLIWLWWMRHADRKEEQIFGYRPVKE